MSELFGTKNQVLNASANKSIFFWGTGAWVEKTIKSLNIIPSGIIDINPNFQNTQFYGINVFSWEYVKENYKDIFIVITTGSYLSVIKQLESENLQVGIDYYCSINLKNLDVKNRLKTLKSDILFSSPDVVSDTYGGGLYIYSLPSCEIKKVYSGKARALCYGNNGEILLSDELNGLIKFDKNFNVINTAQLLPNSLSHGIAYDAKRELIFVANAGRDSVSIYTYNEMTFIKEFKISDKIDIDNDEKHHINDLWVNDNVLYISMFSFTGSWRAGVYDGGVLEYHIEKEQISPYPIISNLWMPHSVKIMDNDFYILDSMRGELYKTSHKKIANFQGFVRGLYKRDNYIYIGQSENRYFDRLDGISNNIQSIAGLHIFDETTKASRFYSIPQLENIHSILVLD